MITLYSPCGGYVETTETEIKYWLEQGFTKEIPQEIKEPITLKKK